MQIAINSLFFLLGLLLLVLSSDWLIQSSVKLSLIFRLTPLFIGLVVIAFGTSAPEAGVGITAVILKQGNIALGNIVGSNIANICLILGLCAIVLPLGLNKDIFKREMPLMLAASVLLYLVSIDGIISRAEGLIFLLLFALFLFTSFRGAKKYFNSSEVDNFRFQKLFKTINSPFLISCIVIFSLAVLVYGANLMVSSGAKIAAALGVRPWIIGITIIAVGTSLPELVATLSASLKKVPSISIGNVVGSNIFNILFVLGVVAFIQPLVLDAGVLKFEMPMLLGFSFLLFTLMRLKYKIGRLDGLLLFLGYIAFIFFLLRRQICS